MIDQHTEIERKFSAEKIDRQGFLKWCWAWVDLSKGDHWRGGTSPDHYWARGENVYRHRCHFQGHHELTVKRRKSVESTEDRLEVDLHFDDRMRNPIGSVRTFLEAGGWKNVLNLGKTADIFFFHEADAVVSVVIYNTWRIQGDDYPADCQSKRLDERHFVEVEVEKGSPCSVERAQELVRKWCDRIGDNFGVDTSPMNESLWEIYSGKKYKTL